MRAIAGGAGLHELPGLGILERIAGDTPFGGASGEVPRGRLQDRGLLFLARHGAGHRLLPHAVNCRANVFARKRAGATACPSIPRLGVPWSPSTRPSRVGTRR